MVIAYVFIFWLLYWILHLFNWCVDCAEVGFDWLGCVLAMV